MHREKDQASAVSGKPQDTSTIWAAKMSQSGKVTLSDTLTGTLKRSNSLRSVTGAAANCGGTIEAFESRTARAACAAAAASTGSSTIDCRRNSFGNFASYEGPVLRRQSTAGARAAEAMLKVDGCGPIAGSVGGGSKFLQTLPARASVGAVPWR